MASPLIQKIEDTFLSCCICFGELRDPIGLPCLHGFCFKCLDEWFQSSQQDKTTVVCPTCRESFPTPKEGIRGFPRHFLIKNLKETVDSEKSKQAMCIRCGKQAEKHCTDCNKSLCGPCLSHHDDFIKDHRVITMEEHQSGQVTDEGRFCKVHGEQVRYYCETEEKGVCTDCVGLKTCPHDHQHVGLKEAAEKQRAKLEEKMKKCNETKAYLQEAIRKTQELQDTLKNSKKQAITDIEQLRKQYTVKVSDEFKCQEENVNKIEKEKSREIDDKLKALQLELGQIASACDQVSEVQRCTSVYSVIHRYQTLSTTIASLSQSHPQVPADDLGYIQFESEKPKAPLLGIVRQQKRWKLARSFVAKGLTTLIALAIDEDGNLVVGSWEKGIKTYTRQGQLKSAIYGDGGVTSTAISPDNRCIFKPRDVHYIQCNDMQGHKLFTSPFNDVHNKPCGANSVAVDSKSRIIVSLTEHTISIHHAEGSLMSKFATKSQSRAVAVTSNEELITSYWDPTLKLGESVVLMDYSGGNIRVIQAPHDVKVWSPTYVCCRQGEIFVVNNVKGDPTGVYRFSSEGKYLGCVTTEVKNPTGIVLSKDGMELYVTEFNKCVINTFTRV